MFNVYRDQTSVLSLRPTWEQADEPQRQAILRALNALDKQLQSNPSEQGESRSDQTRILFEAPLALLYQVDEDKKLVRVQRVWAYHHRTERLDPLG